MSKSPKYKVGQKVVFSGYQDSIDDPMLKEGDILVIREYNPDEDSYAVSLVDSLDTETIYDDEFKPYVAETKAKDAVGGPQDATQGELLAGEEAPEEAVVQLAKKRTYIHHPESSCVLVVNKGEALPTDPLAEVITKKEHDELKAKYEAEEAEYEEVTEHDETEAAVPEASTEVQAPGKEGQVMPVEQGGVAEWLNREDVLVAAKELKDHIDETYYALGGLLSRVYSQRLYETLGYDGNKGFDRYSSTELGIEYRKAMYLINIYDYFTDLGVDYSKLKDIGWSKAKELVGKVTLDNFDEMVEYARNHTRSELIEYIKEEQVDAGSESASEKATKVTYKFRLFDDQANVLNEAVDQFAKENGLTGERSDYLSSALFGIITEWAMLSSDVEVPLEDAMSLIKARYGVELEVSN